MVICIDEKPNMQALTPRLPDIPPAPGHVRRREFDYKRHGTVNLLLGLTVATGEVWGEVLEKNAARTSSRRCAAWSAASPTPGGSK